jgi:hypothetical protein
MMIRKKLSSIALGFLICLLLSAVASNAIAQSQPPGSAPTLYKRVGGYDAIAAVTNDLIGRLAGDKLLERFFGGVSADSQKKLRQHVVDQLCEAAGGPCIYTGRTMKTSNRELAFQKVTGSWLSNTSSRHSINSKCLRKKKANCSLSHQV